MNRRGSGWYARDLSRCREAYELHVNGMNYVEIAECLGVNKTRAGLMVQTWEQHKLLQDDKRDLWEYRNS